MNINLSESSWQQSSLAVSEGGLGIRHAVDCATVSLLASIHCCSDLVNLYLPSGLSPFDLSFDLASTQWMEKGFPLPENPKLQRQWDFEISKNTSNELLHKCSTSTDKARLLAVSSPHAGDWLNAIPSPQLGTLLNGECFRISCALRLGADICLPHKCASGAQVLSNGLHGLSCLKSAGRHSRHNSINDIIFRAFRTAGVPSIKEPPGCSRSDGKRPYGITLIPWKSGRCMAWDFTCHDTFASSYVHSCSDVRGHAAALAETHKHNVYAELEDRFIVSIIAIESSGVIGDEGLKILKSIGQRIAEITGEQKATSFFLQRISLEMQRRNCASILGTLPPGRELYEIFYL